MVSLAKAFPNGFVTQKPKPASYVSATDPRMAFVDHMRAVGFTPPAFFQLGKLIRCPAPNGKSGDDSGWFVYHEFPDTLNKGGNVGVGVFGSWRGEPERETWISKRAEIMSQEERVALSENIERAQQARLADQERIWAEAAIKAQALWATLPDATTHPYLDAKRISAHGAKLKGEALVVPVYGDDGALQSLQYIWPDRKRFMTGGKTRGGFFVIAGSAETVIVCEGFATGATLASATGAMVYVAFNAGNLIDVTHAAKVAYPQARLIVAGDDDVATAGNPGRTKATAAAEISGCEVVFPTVPTDFNDMACAGHDVAGVLTPPQQNRLFINITELLAMPEQIEWTVRGIIERNTFGMIFGASGAGKSFVAIDLAACIATGHAWHGQNVSQGAVTYIAGEGYKGISRRFRAWSIHHKASLESTPIYISRNAIAMGDTSALDNAIREIDAIQQPPQFIVIDTVARAMAGLDENSATDMSKFVAACDKLRNRYNATLIVVHHSGHAESGRARGSSALRAAVDCEIQVARQTDGLRLSCTKAKDSEPFTPLHFSLEPVAIGSDENGDTISSAVLASRGTPSPKKIRPTGKNQIAVWDALKALISESGTDAIAEVSLRDKCGLDAKRFSATIKSLLKAGLISFDNGQYSIMAE